MIELAHKGLKSPNKVLPFLLNQYIDKNYSELVCDSTKLKSISDNFWELPDNTEGLGPSLADDICPPTGNIKIVKKPNFVFKKPFVCEVSDVTIVGPYAVGKTRECGYIADMMRDPIRQNSAHNRVNKTMISELKWGLNRSNSISYFDTIAVIHRASGSQNFYHWILEQVMKLRGIEYYEKETGNDVTLVVSEHIPEFATEAIDLLGFSDHEIYRWGGEKLVTDTLIVPSWPEPTPGNLNWIKSNILKTTTQLNNEVEWVYLSRQNAPRGRRVANFKDLLPILNKHEVSVVQCEEMSLREEIELFRSIEGVISPHGAGLTAMIWSNSLSVIELFNGMIKMPFYVIADLLDHEYTYLIGDSVNDRTRKKRRDQDMIIDPNEFEQLLDNAV